MILVRTFSGLTLDLEDLSSCNFQIKDIAHALSNICRFNGHSKEFYSVAQHSCYVAQLVPRPFALAGLLHDAAEAFVGDMITPIKRTLPAYAELEKGILERIFQTFGLDPELPPEVKEADNLTLAVEAREFLDVDPTTLGLQTPPASLRIVAWPASLAKDYFLKAFDSYVLERRSNVTRLLFSYRDDLWQGELRERLLLSRGSSSQHSAVEKVQP